MGKVHEFLDTYRRLEDALKSFYNGKKVRHQSLVYEYMCSDGKKYYDDLDLCRELRNLLTHHSDIAGSPPAEPSSALIDFLKKVVWEIENPITAKMIETQVGNLLIAHKDDFIEDLVQNMKDKGYSHVPYFRNNMLFGVLSIESLFRYMKDRPNDLFSSVKVSDIEEYLLPENHIFEKYDFVGADTPYREVADLFRAKGPGSVRVAAVFVTKDGSDKGRVEGMITPWDILKIEE